ncbi:hypothetical protein [Pseudomonas chlororaphis]|uniref:hypothetical protein n=1 Tax=Pseudomonas chlororaphis TaxID=587753 RepID=UPI0015DEF457|nr:hypothetical protein [Pseudomonas chlororaphis]QLL13463.1 hypothetical protein H0I86_31660 [Pseudomonas chlororaphis subsp. aurantiaca]
MPITYLPGPAPLETIVSAEALAHHYNAQRIVDSANEKSAQILAELERKMAATRGEIRRIREQARQAGLSEAQEELDRLRADTIAQSVEWLVAEDELERRIANDLDARLRTLLAQALATWLDERNAVDDVMQRVRQRLERMADDEFATLYVAPSVEHAVRERFSATPRVRVHIDAELSEGQARLESRLTIIRFDLEAHRDLILERLVRPCQEST